MFLTRCERAVWITSAPEFAQHEWPGAWVNSLFRNEGVADVRSSELILEALAASRAVLGEPPAIGCVTFVDATAVRRKRDPGRCYRKAGFAHVGFTKERGLHAFQLLPDAMPAAEQPFGHTADLFARCA